VKVVCVLKTGGDFDWSYVERLFKAVSKHTTVEFTFVCFTDAFLPHDRSMEIEVIELLNNWPGWWSKVEMFYLAGPAVYLDLDTVIVGNIDDLLTCIGKDDKQFIMRKNPRLGNMSSNVMAWSGDYSWLIDALLLNKLSAFQLIHNAMRLKEKGQRFRGDQDWITHTLKIHEETILPAQQFQKGIYSYKEEICCNAIIPNDSSLIIFHGRPRPSEVENPPDWLVDNWFALAESKVLNIKKPKVKIPTTPSKCKARRMMLRNRARHRMEKGDTRIREWRPPKRELFQNVPKIWYSETCYILGGGPSLAGVDLSPLNGKHIIAVNNSYNLAFYCEVLFWGDCWWYEQHRKALEQFSGRMITTCTYEINLPQRVQHVRQKLNKFGLSANNTYLTWNLNAGACAVDLAVQLGARRIVLLGYDMRQINGHNNWHDDHRTSVDPSHNPYKQFLLAWPYIAHDAQQRGIEIINATPGSAIDLFPIVDPQELMGGANAVIDDSLCA
jgi:hypothetical protein